MDKNNKLENIISKIRYSGILTKEYMINFGKVFLQHEYENMDIKFVDEKYTKKYISKL